MAKVDELTQRERKRIIFAAVFEHYRLYLAEDCIDLICVQNSGFDKNRFARIARRYEVIRSLNFGEDKNKKPKENRVLDCESRRELIIYIFEKAKINWPDNLSDRAILCWKVAVILQECDLSSRKAKNGRILPLSAVTKLMWFQQPEGWTLYDNLARKALISNCSKETNIHTMTRYYDALAERNFNTVSDEIQQIINETTTFSGLDSTRIIDKFLLLVGMEKEDREKIFADLKIFRRHALPHGVKLELSNLAKEICHFSINQVDPRNPGTSVFG